MHLSTRPMVNHRAPSMGIYMCPKGYSRALIALFIHKMTQNPHY